MTPLIWILKLLFSAVFFSKYLSFVEGAKSINNTPIIGILTQEISYHLDSKYPGKYESYIAASYVKFIESAGARVVPIWIGQPSCYYENIMSHINGVLFPGGGTWFNQSKGYAEAGEYIYRIAIDMNQQGDYMPLWGTCLGFELLTYLSANKQEHRVLCNSLDQPLNLQFKKGYKNSRLYGSMSNKVLSILEKEPVTINYHQFCINEEILKEYGLIDTWNVLSNNYDWNGFQFISSLEHKDYPFYGVQFHPEKNIFEWKSTKKIPHSGNAIRSAWEFAYFFVEEARKNQHIFKNKFEENDCLIYNYKPEFTALVGSSFVQSYMFNSSLKLCSACAANHDSKTKSIEVIENI